MSETKIKMEWVNALPKMTFMEEPEIRDAFIKTNMSTRGTTQREAEMFYDREAMYMKRVIYASIDPNKPRQDLRNCTTFSLYACFQDMAISGDVLSFNPDDKLTYITQRGHKVGKDQNGKDIWENRAKLTISPYGELAIRQDYGQIKYADPAVVVRDGDAWDLETDERSNVVSRWKSKLTARPSNKIIGCFIKITRADGSFVTGYLLQEDIDRLVNFSSRQNGGFANALYGVGDGGQGIDAGFLKAKTLKHSFATFPKVKLKGTNSTLDEQEQEEYEGGEVQQEPVRSAAQEPVGYASPDNFVPASTAVRPGVTVQNPDEEETF